MSKILIVEDERKIAEYLHKYLQNAGFNTLILNSGEHVTETVRAEQPDMIIMDVMLPVKDGTTCCREIREFSDIPVIMLTARITELDRIIGLEAGADDYICKPFNAKELVLRVKSIFKRFNINKPHEGLFLDKSDQQLKFQQTSAVKLTRSEFFLMQLLYSKPSRIYSRQQIINLVFQEEYDITERAVDSHVKNIRKKIRSLGVDSVVIDCVYGAGYQYIPLDI